MKEDICYHRAVHRSTTDSLPQILHAHVTTRHGYVIHVPEQYHTLVTTGQCHTLVTTEQYHMLLPHEITTPSILHRGVYHMIITTGQTTTLVTTVIVV